MTEPVSETFQEPQFQQTLKQGKYTQWACGLTKAHLLGLLWFVGEFRARGHALWRLFDEHPEMLTVLSGDRHDARVALECLFRNDRCDVRQAERWLGSGRSRIEFADLPGSVRAALAAAAPGMEWDEAEITEYGYQLSGTRATDALHSVRVDCAGGPTVRFMIPDCELPEDIRAALRDGFPESEPLFSFRSADSTDYEIALRIPHERSLARILITADGRAIRQGAGRSGRGPVFSPAFRKELDLGKYTDWASNLSEASLEGLLWLVGSVATHTLPKLKAIDAYVELTPWPDMNHLRPRLGLEGILRAVVHGERFDRDQAIAFLHRGLGQWQRDCAKAVPFMVRRILQTVVPEEAAKSMAYLDKTIDGYQWSGEDGRGRHFRVIVRPEDQRVSVEKAISPEEVPALVGAAARAHAPEIAEKIVVWSLGSSWDRIERFRFVSFKRKASLQSRSMRTEPR